METQGSGSGRGLRVGIEIFKGWGNNSGAWAGAGLQLQWRMIPTDSGRTAGFRRKGQGQEEGGKVTTIASSSLAQAACFSRRREPGGSDCTITGNTGAALDQAARERDAFGQHRLGLSRAWAGPGRQHVEPVEEATYQPWWSLFRGKYRESYNRGKCTYSPSESLKMVRRADTNSSFRFK
ncbi:hypothetical protein LIA77_02890 [Sarocladium implicatum]|nr:hypothetical protein LIA77_02890 [Sarocladium implicatum]